MKGTASPSPFVALSFPDSEKVHIYCWVNRESFQVATGSTWVQIHYLLNHNCASLSTRPQCLSYTNIILILLNVSGALNFAKGGGGGL